MSEEHQLRWLSQEMQIKALNDEIASLRSQLVNLADRNGALKAEVLNAQEYAYLAGYRRGSDEWTQHDEVMAEDALRAWLASKQKDTQNG